jgi:hypothetical protein
MSFRQSLLAVDLDVSPLSATVLVSKLFKLGTRSQQLPTNSAAGN